MLYYKGETMEKQVLIKEIEKKIRRIKKDLQSIGDMRPGSISEQFKDPKTKSGAYYQLNYTHKMQTRTEYIRKKNLDVLKQEVAEYQRLRSLIDTWVTLGIQASKLKTKKTNSGSQSS